MPSRKKRPFKPTTPTPALRTRVDAFAKLLDLRPREPDILLWTAAGHISADELGDALGIAAHTVRNHTKRLMMRVGAHTKMAVLAALLQRAAETRP